MLVKRVSGVRLSDAALRWDGRGVAVTQLSSDYVNVRGCGAPAVALAVSLSDELCPPLGEPEGDDRHGVQTVSPGSPPGWAD